MGLVKIGAPWWTAGHVVGMCPPQDTAGQEALQQACEQITTDTQEGPCAMHTPFTSGILPKHLCSAAAPLKRETAQAFTCSMKLVPQRYKRIHYSFFVGFIE
jgi:hypothetical protein